MLSQSLCRRLCESFQGASDIDRVRTHHGPGYGGSIVHRAYYDLNLNIFMQRLLPMWQSCPCNQSRGSRAQH